MEDLQKRVAQQVVGLTLAGQDVAGELAVGRAHALAVCIGGRAADVLAVATGFFVLGEDLDAVEPVLESALVGEAGFVGARVTLEHSRVEVSVLDRGRDQSAGPAADEPGKGAPEA
ncbi:hypothetical protein K4749_33440 [Streptomyces sp. TRM72054]|uniref:hypothetical protein n=1 Tax=Streptomyces sp. TRM72054 TaxID=2870562 RepID=UPI001C8C40CC|nr:hypothetical protein [Streptomyces sp. TRM72054]MBX9398363.1 hypothetical protein [Streptomyces sp. TRM72054]